MKKKRVKKMFIIIIIPISVIILATSGLLVAAAILGRPVEVIPNRDLIGVDETMCDILFYASLAPNSHNAQMWKIDIYPERDELYMKLDVHRLLNVVDPSNREAYISAGCYLANLETAFDAFGYQYEIDIFDAPNENGYFAKASYSAPQVPIRNENSLSIISRRHTDKSKYSSVAIPEMSVYAAIADNSEVRFFKKGSEDFEYLKQGTIDAVKVQSSDQAYRDELAQWMRFSDAEVLEKQDGISAEQIGLKGIVKSFYYWTTTHEKAREDTFANQGINTVKSQVENCNAFFVITGENTINDWIQTGVNTEKFWLNCVRAGISVQPISAMLETSPFSESIQADLSLSSPVQMIIRAGIVEDYGENSTVRLDLDDYITVK